MWVDLVGPAKIHPKHGGSTRSTDVSSCSGRVRRAIVFGRDGVTLIAYKNALVREYVFCSN